MGWKIYSIFFFIGFVHSFLHKSQIHSTPYLQKLSTPLKFGQAIVVDFLPGANVKIKYFYTLFVENESPIECGVGSFYLKQNSTQLNELVLRQGDGFLHETQPGSRDASIKLDCGDVEGRIIGVKLRTQPDLRFRLRIDRKIFKKNFSEMFRLRGGGFSEKPYHGNVFISDLYEIDLEDVSFKFQFFSNLVKEWLFEISFDQKLITTILRSPKTKNDLQNRQERFWSSPYKSTIDGPYVRLLLARVNEKLIIALNDQCFGVFELKTRHYDLTDLAFNRIKITENSSEWLQPWESHILSHEMENLPIDDLQYSSCWDRREPIDWQINSEQ